MWNQYHWQLIYLNRIYLFISEFHFHIHHFQFTFQIFYFLLKTKTKILLLLIKFFFNSWKKWTHHHRIQLNQATRIYHFKTLDHQFTICDKSNQSSHLDLNFIFNLKINCTKKYIIFVVLEDYMQSFLFLLIIEFLCLDPKFNSISLKIKKKTFNLRILLFLIFNSLKFRLI